MFTVDGNAVHCETRGAGPPVLLLHGNPDTSAIWTGIADRLYTRYRCVAPDLPGFGRSEVDLQRIDFSLEGMARWVDAVVDACGITEPINLVVHDFGGVFGLAWAVKHPDRVRSVAMLNTLFQADYRWHFWARVWRTRGLGELSMRLFGLPLLGRASARISMKIGSRKLSLDQIDRMYYAWGRATRATVLRLYRATDPANFEGWEAKMVALAGRVPSLVLWGDRDPYIPKRFAEKFGAREVVHFSDCGHWVPSEEPEAAAQHLQKLFDRARA